MWKMDRVAHDELVRDINAVVNEERMRANERFPLFQSPHEGWAVIKEEFEEAMDEVEQLSNDKYASDVTLAWAAIRENLPAFEYVYDIRVKMMQAVAEMVQCMAMCDKYYESLVTARELSTDRAKIGGWKRFYDNMGLRKE